jgi:tetratricopeptide (TPR) repeat protein
VSLADALQAMGNLEQARSLLSDVIEEARERGDERNEWLSRLTYAELSSSVAPHEWMNDRMKETAERALRVFEALSDDLGLARAWGLAAFVSWNQNHFDEAARQLARALPHARRTGDERQEFIVLVFLVKAMHFGSAHVSEVQRQVERLLVLVGESSAVGFQALLTLAELHAMQGLADESRGLFDRAKSIGEEMRLDLVPAYTAQSVEKVGLALGDAEFAEGHFDAGNHLAGEAVQLSDDTDDLFMHGQVLMAQAEVLSLGGRDADAIPVLRQAVEVSERKGNVVTAREARARLAGTSALAPGDRDSSREQG